MCETCPVPDILRANACERMVLEPELARPFPFLKQQVRVKAYCTKTGRKVAEPHVGCGECHPLPPVFTGEDRGPDSAA